MHEGVGRRCACVERHVIAGGRRDIGSGEQCWRVDARARPTHERGPARRGGRRHPAGPVHGQVDGGDPVDPRRTGVGERQGSDPTGQRRSTAVACGVRGGAVRGRCADIDVEQGLARVRPEGYDVASGVIGSADEGHIRQAPITGGRCGSCRREECTEVRRRGLPIVDEQPACGRQCGCGVVDAGVERRRQRDRHTVDSLLRSIRGVGELRRDERDRRDDHGDRDRRAGAAPSMGGHGGQPERAGVHGQFVGPEGGRPRDRGVGPAPWPAWDAIMARQRVGSWQPAAEQSAKGVTDDRL